MSRRRRERQTMAEEKSLIVPSERRDVMSSFAQEFAEKCVNVLLARLPKPNVVQPRYLTIDQAAVYISHTKRSFEYLISKNLFPVIRRDRLILIDREDLDKFMTRHKA
jgi:excisionase family DNA binding protein